MSDLVKYPLQDGFRTQLSQIWTGGLGTVYVANTPTFTFPSGITTYIVANPGKSNMQIAEINAYDAVAKTVTVSNITLEKGASINSTAQTHNVGSEIIISDNYQFWKDIATAIATKVNKDVTSTIADGIKLNFGATGTYIWSDDAGVNLKFKDGSNPEIDLSSLASGSGADTKVAVSPADTTTGTLSTKLTAGDGLTATIINPAGAEVYDIDITTSDTTVFVKTSSGAGDENKVPVLNASGQLDKGFIDFNAGIQNNYTLGETITAGDQVILNTDGQIRKWAGYGATGSTISTVNLDMVRTFYVDTNTIVTAYSETSTADVIVVAGSVSDAGVVTYGSPVTLDASTNSGSGLEGIKVDTNAGVVMYRDSTGTELWLHPFTVSGTVITAGTRGQVNGSATTLGNQLDICLIDTNKVYMTYANGAAAYPNARVGTIAANAVTFGTEVLNYNSSVAATEVKCCKIDTDKVLTTFIGAAADIITSVATISGTTITVAYANRATYTGTAVNHSIYQVDTNKAIVVFDETDVKAFYITVSSTTPTNQTARTLISTSTLRAGGKPLIQLNSNVYGITGVASLGSITWFNTDTTTYTLPVIKTVNYTTVLGANYDLGYSNALPLTQTGSIGKFFMSTVATTRAINLLNFNTHYLFGIAQESGTVGQSKLIATNGQISTVNSGLSVGEKYYAKSDGTYTVNSTAFGTTAGQVAFMGKALSATSMLIDINLEDL